MEEDGQQTLAGVVSGGNSTCGQVTLTEKKTRSNSTFVLRKVLFKMSMQKWPIM